MEFAGKCGVYRQWNSAVKKSEFMEFAGKWRKPENTILSEENQTKKNKTCSLLSLGFYPALQM